MKNSLLISCLLLIVHSCYSQKIESEQAESRQRFVGVNMSEMVNALVPFKNSTVRSGPFAFFYRSGNGYRFFNFELGARIQSDDFFDEVEDNYLNLQVGMLQRRKLSERMFYTTSQNLIVSAGGLNINSQEFDRNSTAYGISLGAGFEYKLMSRVYVSAYTHFAVTFGDSGSVHFVPPLGIFLVGQL